MKIATLQFNPSLGKIQDNIARADSLITSSSDLGQLDLLVLPELAFTGYNFPSLSAIKPYLEPTTSGISTQWAITTAKRLSCHVTVGYPEHCLEDGKNYNSTVTVSPAGEVLMNYRKSFLYYTDETWASEGPAGSAMQHVSSHEPFFTGELGSLGKVGHGICMDINPYQFTAPWRSYEFASLMLERDVKLVVLSMAWLTRLLPADLAREPAVPDMETVAYWLERFYPFRAADEDVTVVFANRCGMEGNEQGSVRHLEDGSEVETGNVVCYAGSSCVMQFQNGSVKVFEKDGGGPSVLGKGEEGLLVVDTGRPAKYSLHSRQAEGGNGAEQNGQV